MQYRLVADRRTDTRQHIALAQRRRAVKISCGRYYIRVLRGTYCYLPFRVKADRCSGGKMTANQ